MEDLERPPFHQNVVEQLEIAAKRIDADYWRKLKSFQVDYAGPETLSPAKTPVLLLNALTMYAAALFRLEADQYPKSDGNYALWLGALAKRITSRVLRTVRELEASEESAKLSYHGLSVGTLADGLRVLFAIVLLEYAGVPIPTIGSPAQKEALVISQEPVAEPTNPRREFVEPILEAKGWSPLMWAVEAELAYHTIADYLAGKTKPFRDTRLKMATSLGISVQQLPK